MVYQHRGLELEYFTSLSFLSSFLPTFLEMGEMSNHKDTRRKEILVISAVKEMC